MAKQCPHCDMESDRDEYCTWCGKLLDRADEKPQPVGPPAPGKAAAGAPPEGPSAPPAGAKTGAPTKRAPAKIERGRPAWVYYVAVGVGLIVLYVVGCFASAIAASKPPEEPADWKQIESKTKLLALEVPSDWECILAGSGGSFEYVTLRAGKLYTVTLKGTGVKGSISDIGAAAGQGLSGIGEGGLELSTSQTAEGGLHQFIAMTEQGEDPSFHDTSDIQEATFGGRAAACSEYATVRRFGVIAGVKMKGWRMSVPAGDLGYDIRIVCPAGHWDEFYPIGKRIIESGRFGSG